MNSHSSLEQVAGYLAAYCSDGALSAPSRTTSIVSGFLCSAKMTESLTRSRSGQTLEHSTGAPGLDTWISSLAGSRAKTSAPPGTVPESAEPVADCGERWPVSLAKFDRNTCSWKIPQHSLFEEWESSLEIWPRWGLMRNGECWERTPLAHHTCGKGCSLWPTPVASMGKHGYGLGRTRRYSKKVEANCRRIGWTPSSEMQEAVQGWPIGWTDLKPLEMAKFREWLDLHGRH